MKYLALNRLLVSSNTLLELFSLPLLGVLLPLKLLLEPPPSTIHSSRHTIIILNAVGVVGSKVGTVGGR